MRFDEGKKKYKEVVTDYSKAWFGDGLPRGQPRIQPPGPPARKTKFVRREKKRLKTPYQENEVILAKPNSNKPAKNKGLKAIEY